MLDRAKLAALLFKKAPQLFSDTKTAHAATHHVWRTMVSKKDFFSTVRKAPPSLGLCHWTGDITQYTSCHKKNTPYIAFSVDGSQIYPNKHQGVSCFLINIGLCAIAYGQETSAIICSSDPYIFTPDDLEQSQPITHDTVGCKRQEYELAAGIAYYQQVQRMDNASPEKPILLFDGSLIFWHLQSKDQETKNYYVKKYETYITTLYEKKIPYIGYISMPKSKDLVKLACFAAAQSNIPLDTSHLVDTHIVRFFVPSNARTTVFKSNTPQAALSGCYATHFFYLNTGFEIARVEIPQWIAADTKQIQTITQILLDQCIKGEGYPVLLSEAHEQAVVKTPDRELFFHLLGELAIESNYRMRSSQKNSKKKTAYF